MWEIAASFMISRILLRGGPGQGRLGLSADAGMAIGPHRAVAGAIGGGGLRTPRWLGSRPRREANRNATSPPLAEALR